jgi:hypothetical protein
MNLLDQVNQLRKEVDTLKLKSVSPLEDIILKADYRVLGFFGTAGTIAVPLALSPAFNQSIVSEKKLLIKAVHVIPYADDVAIDIELNDGATTTTETITANMRLNRVWDLFGNSLTLRIRINGDVIAMFPTDGSGNAFLPMDLSIDNIFYVHRKIVQTIEVDAGGLFADDFAGGSQSPNLYVLLECYIY